MLLFAMVDRLKEVKTLIQLKILFTEAALMTRLQTISLLPNDPLSIYDLRFTNLEFLIAQLPNYQIT